MKKSKATPRKTKEVKLEKDDDLVRLHILVPRGAYKQLKKQAYQNEHSMAEESRVALLNGLQISSDQFHNG